MPVLLLSNRRACPVPSSPMDSLKPSKDAEIQSLTCVSSRQFVHKSHVANGSRNGVLSHRTLVSSGSNVLSAALASMIGLHNCRLSTYVTPASCCAIRRAASSIRGASRFICLAVKGCAADAPKQQRNHKVTHFLGC